MNLAGVFSLSFSPPCQGGVAAASIKSREATEAPQTGAERERDSAKHKEWSITRHFSERIPKQSLRLTTPSAPFSEGDYFLMARPPLLGKEGNVLPVIRSRLLSPRSVAASRLFATAASRLP